MAVPTLPPAEPASLLRNNDVDGHWPIFTFSFSRSMSSAKQLAFGILTIAGCLLVQFLLVTWLALFTAQVELMHLQARMLERVYGNAIEKPQPARKKNIVRIEIASPQGKDAQKAQTIKKNFLFDEHISLKIRCPVSNWPTRVSFPHAVNVTPPAPRASSPANSPIQCESQPAELNTQPVEAAPPKVTLPTLKVSSPVSNPAWQTKSVRGRKTDGGRAYAVKQVDVFTPMESFLEPTPGTVEALESFLEPTSATTVAIAPSESVASGETTMQSFPTPIPTMQRPALTPRPVVKLPGMNLSSTNELCVPKEKPKLQSPTLAIEEHPAVFAPRKARRSAIRLVKPETSSYMAPDLPQSQTEINDNLEKVEVKDLSEPIVSQDASNIAMNGPEPTIFANVEPLEIDRLRHRFLETSVLKEVPPEKPQHQVLPTIHPTSPEENAREALTIAFNERECLRVELSMNYSQDCVERFLEKAQEYKARRKALALLMPARNLSPEDEASFPHLSSKDTDEPQVGSPVVNESQRPFPLPSPPTSIEEDHEQVREDPEILLGKASRAYQMLLLATKKMDKECSTCNSEFCLNAYSPAGRHKMSSTKGLYTKARSKLVNAYEPGQFPESLAKQLPVVEGC